MRNDTKTAQRVNFLELHDKPLRVQSDQPDSSIGGGAVLLMAADKKLGLTASSAASLSDKRNLAAITHSYRDLLRQRIFGLACGYEDCNDAARLNADPMHRLMLDRDQRYFCRLPSFLALGLQELDLLAFFQRFIAFHLDRAMVDKNIFAGFVQDKAESFRVIEPFDCAD